MPQSWLNDEDDYEKKSWSFGVLTNARSTETPIGYHFVSNVEGTDWDYCDADQVVHWTRNVRAKAKRGFGDFYKPHLYLMRADRVLTNTAEGIATQAAIAYIVEHPQGGTQANAAAIAAKYAPGTGRFDPRTGEQQRKRRMAPNTRIDTPAGAKYHASLLGSNNGQIYIAVMESALRLAGTVHAFPEGMLTGSYQNANYASSLTAESPFVQGRVAEQMHRAARVKDMFLKILKLACERGRFRRCGIECWEDMRKGLKIEIQPAKVFPKNIKETTDALVVQKAQGWVDDKTAMTELGRDYDAVRLQQSIEKKANPQAGTPDGQEAGQSSDQGDQAAPSGIYSQISRQQWIRNGKAIQDVVGNLVSGEATPTMASVMLRTLGLDDQLIQSIIKDVTDRSQESYIECVMERKKNDSVILLESVDQRKDSKLSNLLEQVTPFRMIGRHGNLIEGGPGSGVTGHTTYRPSSSKAKPASVSAPRDYDIKEIPAEESILGTHRVGSKRFKSIDAAKRYVSKIKKEHKAEDDAAAAKEAVRKAREIYDSPHKFTKAEYIAAMTKGETVQRGNETAEQYAARRHHDLVRNEVSAGRDVPDNVLKDYPQWIKPKSFKLSSPANFRSIDTGGPSSFNNVLNSEPHYIDKDLVDMAYDGIHHSEHPALHQAISTVRPDMKDHSQASMDNATKERAEWAKRVAAHEAEKAAAAAEPVVRTKRKRS